MASSEKKCIRLFCNERLDSKESIQVHLLNHPSASITIIPLQVCADKNERYLFPEENHSQIEKKFSASRSRVNKQSKTIQFCVHACSTCGKEFKRKDHLNKHAKIHTGIKPYSCLICGKSFSRKDRLKEHCSIHLSKGWSCYFCGKMFSQRCILRIHEMIHRGIKPHICDLCDSRFSRKNDLVRHQTSHTGEKNHFCEVCGKGFSQKRLVNRHMVTHRKKNNEKPDC